MRYDASVIDEMAENLYANASFVEGFYAVVGILVGGSLAFVVGRGSDALWPLVVFGACLLGLLGYWIGHQRAMMLRLFAQLILAHAQIEENTRPTSDPQWTPHPTKDTRAAADRISNALNR